MFIETRTQGLGVSWPLHDDVTPGGFTQLLTWNQRLVGEGGRGENGYDSSPFGRKRGKELYDCETVLRAGQEWRVETLGGAWT